VIDVLYAYTGPMPGSPQTPSRRSVRLLAKQLYYDELIEAAITPVHKRHNAIKQTSANKPRKGSDVEDVAETSNKPVVTPPQTSMHSHFLDSRQLSTTDLESTNKTPVRRASLRSPSRHEMTESVRRSPRLSAKQDLLGSPASAAKTNVCPVNK